MILKVCALQVLHWGSSSDDACAKPDLRGRLLKISTSQWHHPPTHPPTHTHTCKLEPFATIRSLSVFQRWFYHVLSVRSIAQSRWMKTELVTVRTHSCFQLVSMSSISKVRQKRLHRSSHDFLSVILVMCGPPWLTLATRSSMNSPRFPGNKSLPLKLIWSRATWYRLLYGVHWKGSLLGIQVSFLKSEQFFFPDV